MGSDPVIADPIIADARDRQPDRLARRGLPADQDQAAVGQPASRRLLPTIADTTQGDAPVVCALLKILKQAFTGLRND